MHTVESLTNDGIPSIVLFLNLDDKPFGRTLHSVKSLVVFFNMFVQDPNTFQDRIVLKLQLVNSNILIIDDVLSFLKGIRELLDEINMSGYVP